MDFDIERQEVGSEYDLRTAERNQIAQLAAAASESFVNLLSSEEPDQIEQFLSISEELAYRFSPKVPDNREQDLNRLFADIQRLRKKNNSNNSVDMMDVRDVRKLVIDLRDSANLALPSKTKTNEEAAFLD